MTGWIDVSPVVKYQRGDRDGPTVRAAESAVRAIAQKALRRFAFDLSQEVMQDVESEVVCVFFDKVEEPYVDFERYSAFNFVFTIARNAVTNVRRKEPRETTLAHMSEEAEDYVMATATEGATLDSPTTGALVESMKRDYARSAARAAEFGLSVEAFDEMMMDGYSYDDESFGAAALLVAALRTLVARSVEW